MPTEKDPASPPPSHVPPAAPPGVYFLAPPPKPGLISRFRSWVLLSLLMASLAFNFGMVASYKEYFSEADGPSEKYHSGDRLAKEKVAIIRVSGTIMPPFTRRVIQAIEKARDDDQVKGVILAVNSPGGLVTDSHQIYHRLRQLSEKKPIYVSMGSMAASGGVYVAMGAGPSAKIFGEPTTWTGSIGVIIPHYEVAELAEKIGVRAAPLKTGEFKDALSPFRPLTDRDKALWDDIMNQSFEQFLQVIDDGREKLNLEQVRALATGQIYTARDAKANGLIDEIGYEEDAIDALKQKLGLTKTRIVSYHTPLTLVDALLGSAQARDSREQWQTLVDATVPRAMYFCSWGQFLPIPGSE